MEIGDISPSIFDKGWVSGGALPKIGDGERGHIDPLFSTRSHPLTPFFHSLSSNDSLFLIIHNQFWTISHRMTPFLGNISSNLMFFQNFCQICVQIHTLRGKFTKICLILTVWPRFCWSSHWMTPFFGEKSLTERPLVLSCCPSTPVTSKVECPPPGWGWNVITPRCCKE